MNRPLSVVLLFTAMQPSMPARDLSIQQNKVVEWGYHSTVTRDDPFQQVSLTARITTPDGASMDLPGFWAGGPEWRFRYASDQPGTHRFETVCNDPDNAGLHGQTGKIEVTPYEGDNPLYRHGTLKVSADRRHLTHLDGKPFLWLADSWWHGMTTRFAWPEDFKALTLDRRKKGFNVIQFAIGFPCDIEPFDPRGQNEAGDPWLEDFTTINPAYFDLVDQRVNWLVEEGMLPNIVGAWGYYMKFMGVEKMKAHWDYLIARYGAYPVTWTLCGEATLAYYPDLENDWDAYKTDFRDKWSHVARHIQDVDPFDRLLTVHPGPGIHDGKPPLDDMEALDFVMVQSGHGGFQSLDTARAFMTRFLKAYPDKPVLHGEVCFEGMNGGGSGQRVQRFLFWTDMLSGACGFSYGAEGIWQFNTEEFLFGPSPGGNTWGNIPWETASQYPGGTQLGIGKRLLENHEWWRLEPRPDAVEEKGADDLYRTYVAGIGESVRMAYLFNFPTRWRRIRLIDLDPDQKYRATYLDPITGDTCNYGEMTADDEGSIEVPDAPIQQDWVLVLEK